MSTDPQAATIRFLTGRKAHIAGMTHRDDDGVPHRDVFLVVGKAQPDHGHGFVQVQDVIDGMISVVPVDWVEPV
jgi:hypothetical protein